MGGVNDAEHHANELAELLLGGPMRPFVNIIPYNATRAGRVHNLTTPTTNQLQSFRSLLRGRGLRATVRWSTADGRPLTAACGQLTGASGRLCSDLSEMFKSP